MNTIFVFTCFEKFVSHSEMMRLFVFSRRDKGFSWLRYFPKAQQDKMSQRRSFEIKIEPIRGTQKQSGLDHILYFEHKIGIPFSTSLWQLKMMETDDDKLIK